MDTELIRQKFGYWSRWFLPQFFQNEDAPDHKEQDTRIINIYKLGGSFLNIAYRGEAKTNRGKLLRAFFIANDEEHYRKYFKILSKDLGNATQIVTDIYNVFMKPRVMALYPEVFEKTTAKREETMSSFTTSTGIKMIADTIGTDQRGDIQEESRPDFILFVDFETRISLMSAQITHKIGENMEEARTGLSKDGGIVYECNYISERGNVHKLVQKIKNQMNIPIAVKENGHWVPTWGSRYTEEDIIKIENEAEDFEGEYLNKPSATKDIYFDRESVDRQVPKPVIEEIAGLKIFRKYDPSHRIGSGHDIGGGVGLDSSTSVFMDFDCNPIQVMATYKNNEIKPDAFAYEIMRQGKRFGESYMAVEKNYGSTIDILKTIYPTAKIHKTQRKPKIVFQAPIEYGYETNASTKPKMLTDFAQAVEKGIIELNDPDLIAEVRSYTLNDLMDKEVDPRLTTRHFDLLMAACIAWQINKFVRIVEKKEYYDPYWPKGTTTKKNPAR